MAAGTFQALELRTKLQKFMDEHVYPAEPVMQKQHDALRAAGDPWRVPQMMEDLKAKAKAAGLWNFFLPSHSLSNLDYAPLSEIMGAVPWASEVFNCSAPDTGNMEVLARYGTKEQQERWLTPLLEGKIRSTFCMTEPAVASSDATNMALRVERLPSGGYRLNGTKWWSSGVMDPRCELLVVMGRVDGAEARPAHGKHSMLLVPKRAKGVTVLRHLSVFGYDDAPHGHGVVRFDDVTVGADAILLGDGRGFEIAQGRLGPGRIHHCMRSIGLAERGLKLLCERAASRSAFGAELARKDLVRAQVAESRMEIDQARLLTLTAAHKMDQGGNKAARKEIAMIKVVAPRAACAVLDRAIQVHGGAGVSQDFPLAAAYCGLRSLRIADGPDEVHLLQLGRAELMQQLKLGGRRPPAAKL